MKHAMNALAALASRTCLRRAAVLACAATLAACGALPQPPQQPQLYDLGLSTPASSTTASAPAPALALDDIEAPAGVGLGTTLYYRLAYANDQQLRPYQRARWSQPPATLVQQRLREHLGAQRSVLSSAERTLVGAGEPPPAVLRLALEEFVQVFPDAHNSHGLLRLRATLVQPQARGERLLGQRLFTIQRPAPSPDAAGGVRALSAATDQLAQELTPWLASLQAGAAAAPAPAPAPTPTSAPSAAQ